jgi:thiol:disulfide interchange protein DsbA
MRFPRLSSILLSCVLGTLSLLAIAAPVAPAAPLEGRDYVLIDGGQPYAPQAGKIEVAEVFGYWCPHCAQFQPQLSAWKRTLPADVQLTYVPAVFTAGDNFARAYFVAEHLGVLARTHDAMYQAIHDDGLLPLNPSVAELAAYYGQNGLDAARASAYMQSPEVDAKLERARQFALRSGVEGTPTLIIDGRYRITAATHEDGLRIARQLIDQLRAARRAPAQS